MGRWSDQEGLVELEDAGELLEELVHTVEPLQEHGTLLAHVAGLLLVPTAVPELVPEIQPLCLHQNLEALNTELRVIMPLHFVFKGLNGLATSYIINLLCLYILVMFNLFQNKETPPWA